MRFLLLIVALAACAPAPVLRPDRDTRPRGEPEVRRENVLEVAPGGTVLSRSGASVDLASLWEKQPVVVVFYRGHWCPHCQYQFRELQKRKEEFTAAGATLIAISVDPPADLEVLRTKLGLTFELYSDADLVVIRTWGVEDYGKGISKTATFIVQPGGAISFRKIGEKPEDRPSTQDILDALAAKPAP